MDNFVDGYSENNVAEIQVFYIVEINLPNRGPLITAPTIKIANPH